MRNPLVQKFDDIILTCINYQIHSPERNPSPDQKYLSANFIPIQFPTPPLQIKEELLMPKEKLYKTFNSQHIHQTRTAKEGILHQKTYLSMRREVRAKKKAFRSINKNLIANLRFPQKKMH